MTRKWTIIRNSGSAETLWGKGEKNASPCYSYLDILHRVYSDGMSGGSNYDEPNMLLSDGRIVIPEGLWGIAYRYGQEMRDTVETARKTVDLKHNREFD